VLGSFAVSQPAAPVHMTHAEYRAHEATAATKHEYLRGEVFAMAGGTPEHARLQARMAGELARLLAGRPCEAYSSDLRVRVVETDFSTYPDLTVVCGQLETAADDADAAVNPVLLVEVLSDSTEASDRGEKFAHYRRLPRLREYVLVSQRAHRIEVFRRAAGRSWEYIERGPGETVRLESIDVEISVDAVYASRLTG
jgi:Uma2 family endonuclease